MVGSRRVESGRDWTSAFQNAALDPSQWLSALQELADATGSSRAELVGFGRAEYRSFNWVTSTNQKLFEDFLAADGTSPAANFRIAADDGTSILTGVDERHYDLARRGVKSDVYLDFCEQHDMVFGCQTTLHRDGDGLVGMSLLRSRADGRTDEEIRGIFARAAYAAQTAVRMQTLLEDQGIRLLTGTLDAMSLSCLLLDGLGRVRHVSLAAEKALSSKPLLSLRERRISSDDAATRRRIDLALTSVLGVDRKHHARVLLGAGNVADLVLDIFALPVRDWTMHFAPSAIVVIRVPSHANEDNAVVLTSTFGLTGAELEIALALYRGTPRQIVAAERGVTVDTIRTQIRSIYAKTGCQREAELFVLMKAVLE